MVMDKDPRLGRAQPYDGGWELIPATAEIAQVFAEARRLFGLDGSVGEAWEIEVGFAVGAALEGLRASEEPACILTNFPGERVATIYLDREAVEGGRFDLERIAHHELSHIVISPFNASGILDKFDEILVIHVELACWMLQQEPEAFAITNPDDLGEIVAKAVRLTRLDENGWQIHIEKKKAPVIWCGERLPAFGYSLFYQNTGGWGVFAARQAVLELDLGRIEEQGLSLADTVLKELWRIVLNSRGAPEDVSFNIQERQLARIMRAMKALGWGRRA